MPQPLSTTEVDDRAPASVTPLSVPAAPSRADPAAHLVPVGMASDWSAVLLCTAVAARPVEEVVRLVSLLGLPDGPDVRELHRALRTAAVVRSVDDVAELTQALRGWAVPEGAEDEGEPEPGPAARAASTERPVEEEEAPPSGSTAGRGAARPVRGGVPAAVLLCVAAAAHAPMFWERAQSPVLGWLLAATAACVLLAMALVRRGTALVWAAAGVLVAVVLAVDASAVSAGHAPGLEGQLVWRLPALAVAAITAEVLVLLLSVVRLGGSALRRLA